MACECLGVGTGRRIVEIRIIEEIRGRSGAFLEKYFLGGKPVFYEDHVVAEFIIVQPSDRFEVRRNFVAFLFKVKRSGVTVNPCDRRAIERIIGQSDVRACPEVNFIVVGARPLRGKVRIPDVSC